MRLLLAANLPYFLNTFLRPYALHFRSLGWTVHGAARGAEQDEETLAAFDSVFNLPVDRNLSKPWRLARTASRLRDLVDRKGYDIVHVHTPLLAFLLRWALENLRRTRRLAVIYTAHGFYFHRLGTPLRNAVFRHLEGMASAWTDHLVVINREDEREARSLGLMPEDRLTYMPGIGIDTNAFAPGHREDPALRSTLGVPDSAPIFLLMAEFTPEKRHGDALRALSLLRHGNAHLICVGEGTDGTGLSRMAEQAGVSNRVHGLGFHPDPRALLAAACATVLPSEREGLSRTVMESLSCEVPVIGSNARGVQDLLVPDHGTVVPVGHVPALARAMDHVLDHPESSRAEARRGRRSIVKGHDLSLLIPLHEQLYSRYSPSC